MKPLALLLCLATHAMAQAPTDLPPPPLVDSPGAPAADGPPPEPPPEPPAAAPDAPSQLLQPTSIANPRFPAATPAATARAEGPGRPLRIAMGLLIGTGVGVLGGLAGLGLGSQTLAPDALPPLGGPLLGALAGWLVGLPLGVLGSGWLYDGDGSLWATLAGELVGVAASAVAVWFGGGEGIPLTFGLPLVGAVVGYEASSSDSRAAVAPTASVSPRGQVSFGLSGRF